MNKIIISLGTGLLAGYALSFLHSEATVDTLPDFVQGGHIDSVECVCDMQRSRDLDHALEIERDTNNLLIAEIDKLQSEVDRLHEQLLSADSFAGSSWLQSAWEDLTAHEAPIDRQRQMIDAGFDPVRAAWLLQRESQLQVAAIGNHQRDAANVQPLAYLDSRLAARQALREEIGDFEYEQYLAATGQSTAVAVTQVLTDSSAQSAGLKVGDVIVDFDGERVFNMIELTDQAGNGEPNEVVLINIERNGVPMQFALPRGTLGIIGGKPTEN